MKFSIKTVAPGQNKNACVVVGVYSPRKLSNAAQALDRAAKGYIGRVVRRDMEGKSGTSLLLHNVPHIGCDRVLLIGLGDAGEFREKEYRESLAAAVRMVSDTGAEETEIHLSLEAVGKRDVAWRVKQATLAAGDAHYRFEQMKSKKQEHRRALRSITWVVERSGLRSAQAALVQAEAAMHGVALAKDLGNLPGNVCTPAYLVEQAQHLAQSHHLQLDVLERKDMEKLGMGALLSVARGSAQPPKLITVQYRGAGKKDAPVALVGKGITFDTGGISLKPAAEMDEMKFDMSGAGSVLGTIKAIAEMRTPLNITGIVPTTENMPGGRATKPGDIVTTLSGQTVEVLNTDAEGRLILCDALTYAERFKPAAVIDIATLTGACVIALGHVASGLFANDDQLARQLIDAGDGSYDRVWHMPLWDDYQEQLRSNFADFANIGGRPAGSVTAACFLSRFTKQFKWAHLDVAGTAWRSGREKGSTGRPVPLLTQFLLDRAAKK
ncbi:MAG TPA: leucyl aminopeptidase [Burkholderiales bacterium]|nr:leucyl aminopeptidase [Burkholderiales bacterium]